MLRTAYIYDDLFTRHEMGFSHPESPRRLIAIKEVLDGDGVGRELVRFAARIATIEEIALVHDENYIKRIELTKGRELTALDPDTSCNAYTWDAACLAAGGFIELTAKIAKGDFKNGFAFVRPPGHHAERARAMGFCIFNNVAIAADWLIKNKVVERLAIIDFDVHHCNGTQHSFYKRGDIFVVSTHREHFYPGTGSASEIGEGEGRQATLNIPMHAASTDDDYNRVFEETIVPAVTKYKPQMILVSAGFDSHMNDPLGGMRVSTAGFRKMMETLLLLAGECCGGKLAATLEGGYDLKALRTSVEAQLEKMTASKEK